MWLLKWDLWFSTSATVLHLLTQACVQVFSSPRKALFLLWFERFSFSETFAPSSSSAGLSRFLALCERRLGSFLDVISEQDPEALCFGQFNAGRVWSLRHTLADIRIVTDTRTFASEGTFIDIVADVLLSSRHFRDGWMFKRVSMKSRSLKAVQSHRPGDGEKIVFLNWPIQRDEATTTMFLVQRPLCDRLRHQRPPASISSSTLFYGFDGFMS